MFNTLIFIFIFLFFERLSSETHDSPEFKYKENVISWEKWLNNLKIELKSLNLKADTVKILSEIKFNSRVVELDKKQPEFKLTFNQYLSKVITPNRVEIGRLKLKEHFILMKDIEKIYKVSPHVIVSLWGIETSYGKHKGKFDVLNSLASLSYDGRRANFFLKELKHSLKIIDDGHISRKNLKGSWAGAFGHTQFMPSTFVNYAQDFDNDGKKDLLNNYSDALASGANYLSKMGWKNEFSWGEEFLLDGLKINEFSGEINENFQLISYWKSKGFKPKKHYNEQTKLRLISVKNEDKKKFFLVTKNFDIILKWNKSNFFALAVGLLADKFKKNE